MKIYLDTCALLRLTDDQRQPRIYREAQAVENVLDAVERGELLWTASSALSLELSKGRDTVRRDATLDLLTRATVHLVTAPGDFHRAHRLHHAGYGNFDALHLALAERAEADVLLTTDDQFISLAQRGAGSPLVLVVNPVDWWQIEAGRVHDLPQ